METIVKVLNESSLCKEIDQKLIYSQLPAHMIVAGFIIEEKKCNYEIYMREFLNESAYFRKKSKGTIFEAPIDESYGQPDAISKYYEIDFKLMTSSSFMEANSLLSGQIIKYMDGMYGFGAPKKANGKSKCIQLCQVLRYKEIHDLKKIENNKPVSSVDKEIKSFLKKLRVKKNIMFFLPYEFSYEEWKELDEGIDGIAKALFFDLKSSVEYREKHISGYECFLTTIYENCMWFFKLSSSNIEIIDKVSCEKSLTYTQLKSIRLY